MVAVWIDAHALDNADTDDHDPRGWRALLEAVQSVSMPAWHADAACREHDPELWFPERGQDARPAMKVCEGCLARDECLEWALGQPDSLKGIWGGTSGRERRRLNATRRAA